MELDTWVESFKFLETSANLPPNKYSSEGAKRLMIVLVFFQSVMPAR